MKQGELPIPCQEALARGNMIEAIKYLRTAQHLGLKEAKDALEASLRDDPALKERYAKAQVAGNRGGGGWLALLMLVVAAVAYLVYSGRL